MRLSHDPYYRDRRSEFELCKDFPADEIFIDGLHAMQCHFWNNNVAIDIPVVRVMNTAHWLAAYMFSTECSGDQLEYEAMASMSIGRDRKLAIVTMIVLAAMLQRTEGFRAQQCRNVILDNRPPDFEEGVTLYDRFLRSAEKRFSMEDFLTDIPALVEQNQQLQSQVNQLTSENTQLKYTITTMEQKYQQINIGTQNNNYGTINNYYGFSQPSSSHAEDIPAEDLSSHSPESDSGPLSSAPDVRPEKSLFCRITQAAYDKGIAQQVDDELRSASVSAPKLVKALRTNDALGYTDTKNLQSTDLYNLLDKHYHLPFKSHAFSVARSK